MQLSVVIPFRNEEENLPGTLENIHRTLLEKEIRFEIVAVNDYSTDSSYSVAQTLQKEMPFLVVEINAGVPGFGSAVAHGLKTSQGKYIAVVMADGAEHATDIVLYYKTISDNNLDMVLGSRFINQSSITNYPFLKLLFNRLGNYYFSYRSGVSYNDFTNAFKIYSRKLIQKISPLNSTDFSITIELCCKALKAGASYQIIPVGWLGRERGYSKFNLYRNSINYIRTFSRYY